MLEIHAHADHLSGAQHMRTKPNGDPAMVAKLGIGSAILSVQETFARNFDLGLEFAADGSRWDYLFEDGASVPLGKITNEVIHTPGHTPVCVCYHIGDAMFTGHVIFMSDIGTSRCDFSDGSAQALHASL